MSQGNHDSADPRHPGPTTGEPRAKEALLRCYAREMAALDTAPPFSFQIGRVELVCLIAACQLACRHPSYTGPSRKVVEEIVRQMTEAAFQDFPATKAVVNRGWDERYDDVHERET